MYEYLDRRYALALYKVAEEKGKIEEYRKDLKSIVKMVYSNKDMLQLIKHPQISTSKKKEIFIKIFKNKIDEDLLSFLLILIEKDRILYLKQKQKQFEKMYRQRNNILRAHIKTVIPLDDEDRKLLIDKLEKKYNKKIILKENIDKSIIGGVYIRVGDDIIDDTIKSKINDMRKLVLEREQR